MFIDETIIDVNAGDGGNGCYAHQRARGRPRGRPNGGDGGRGGHIYVVGSVQVHTLQDVSYHKLYKADRGDHGKGSRKDGRNGEDITILVPIGTLIIDDKKNDILYDCVKPDKPYIIARGGRGGRGNGSLVSKTNPHPEYAEYGKPGECKRLRFVLKILADVGLVGRPNAGKSTFLSTVSHAHPKIAEYPFTTTEPQLGIVKVPDTYDSYVVADIPGLIEGAHTGKGLGIRFLKHIERTRVIAFLVEATSEDPTKDIAMLQEELGNYSPALTEKPACYFLTKCDLVPNNAPLPGPEWQRISSVTGEGINDGICKLKKMLDSLNNYRDTNLDLPLDNNF